jgi:hypothetical protein
MRHEPAMPQNLTIEKHNKTFNNRQPQQQQHNNNNNNNTTQPAVDGIPLAKRSRNATTSTLSSNVGN